jgi:hypothetical protein
VLVAAEAVQIGVVIEVFVASGPRQPVAEVTVGVLALTQASVMVVAKGRNWATSVTGSTNAWFDTGNWKLAGGRIFDEDEQRAGESPTLRPASSPVRHLVAGPRE